MSASFGGVCTVLLLACFVPAATAVRRLSYDSAAGATDAERKAWLEAEGITVSWQEWFGRIATALGPLIAGTSLPAIAEVVK